MLSYALVRHLSCLPGGFQTAEVAEILQAGDPGERLSSVRESRLVGVTTDVSVRRRARRTARLVARAAAEISSGLTEALRGRRVLKVYRVVPTESLLRDGPYPPLGIKWSGRWWDGDSQAGQCWSGSREPIVAWRERLYWHKPTSYLGSMLPFALPPGPVEYSVVLLHVVVARRRVVDLTKLSRRQLRPLMRGKKNYKESHRVANEAIDAGAWILLAPSSRYFPRRVRTIVIGYYGGPGQPGVGDLPEWEEVERWSVGGEASPSHSPRLLSGKRYAKTGK